MTNQAEQWSLIFCVILPIGYYLMLITLDKIDDKGAKWNL